MSDLLARLDSMIEALTEAGSSRCSRSTAAAQTPTGTTKALETKEVPVVPVVPAGKQNIIRHTDISRTEEQSLQHTPQGKAPLSLSSKRTGTTGTGQVFRGVERSRHFTSNGNSGNREAWPEPEIPHPAPKENRLPVHPIPQMRETSPEASRCSSGTQEIEQIVVTLRTPEAHASGLHRLLLDAERVGPTAPEPLKDDLVEQLSAHQAEAVDVRRQPCCAECQEPITAAVTDWLGGLPVHHSCGITAWRREWQQDQQRGGDDEN